MSKKFVTLATFALCLLAIAAQAEELSSKKIKKVSIVNVPVENTISENVPTQKSKALKNSTIQASSTGIVSRILPQVSGTLSNYAGNDAGGSNSKMDIGFGLTADIGRSNTVFETGLLFRQLGAKTSNDDVSIKFNFNYLGLPLMAKHYLNGQSQNTVYFKGGLVPQVLVSSSGTASGPGGSITLDQDLLNNFLKPNSLTLDATLALGGKIAISSQNDGFAELTYTRGLTSVTSAGSVFDSVLALNVGVSINL